MMEAIAIDQTIPLMELLKQLHAKRSALEAATTIRQGLEDEFRASHQDFYDTETCLKTDVAALDMAIRNAALHLYDTDPEKKKQVCPGVGIRVGTEYVYDRDEAFAWAKNHGLCLSLTLDAKAFNDLCKAESTRPEFVRTVENRSATIATDLGKVLEEE